MENDRRNQQREMEEDRRRAEERRKGQEAFQRTLQKENRAVLQKADEESAALRKLVPQKTNYAGDTCYHFNQPPAIDTPNGIKTNSYAADQFVCH